MSTMVVGAQEPRIAHVPEYASSTGEEAIELCRMAGLALDPWQEYVLAHSLGEREDGRWAAFEVGLVVSRQNGKGTILEARELVGLFLLGERLIIHSAHQFDTSMEHFRRLLELIEDTPDFDRRVMRVSQSHGAEGIELRGGQRIRFRTRTKKGGRGFTGDLLVLDEAMELAEAFHGALLPTLAARSISGNPQVWYAASAVDQFVHENGVVLARVRERGLRGEDPGLAYFEWSVAGDDPEKPLTPDRVDDDLLADQQSWEQANPGLGIRISSEHVDFELRSLGRREFAVERLGIGDWPVTTGLSVPVIDVKTFLSLGEEDSCAADPVVFAFDVAPDRSQASIAVAGNRADGAPHVEVVDSKRGTGWVVARLVQLVERHQASAVVCDGIGPASSLLPELAGLGVEVATLTAGEYGSACGLFFDLVAQGRLRHLETPDNPGAISQALACAQRRPLGEKWAWSRKNSTGDITALVAPTVALWQLAAPPEKPGSWKAF